MILTRLPWLCWMGIMVIARVDCFSLSWALVTQSAFHCCQCWLFGRKTSVIASASVPASVTAQRFTTQCSWTTTTLSSSSLNMVDSCNFCLFLGQTMHPSSLYQTIRSGHLFILKSIYPSIHTYIHPFIHQWIRSSVYLFVHSLISPFNHLFISCIPPFHDISFAMRCMMQTGYFSHRDL